MPNANRTQTAALIRTLIEDVIAARQRLDSNDTQTARRDVVRASFAAIEGEIWLARQHVRDSLQSLDELTPLADLALRETAYIVTDKGEIVLQERGVPIHAAMRLVAKQAQIICPELSVEFGGQGWADLRGAAELRNRITHPRPGRSLDVAEDDLRLIASALNWVIATTDYIMASTNLTLVQVRDFVDKLVSGDPDALAQYQAALDNNS